ncbi:glutathione S-transferase family protein [Stenomitos frigidus]|uniref:glutathione transferase n=1 Tax=Stenomitos frigidus ULC18 TaxID=2107698 RepID=A0A2T1DWR2_9CYAN|nr:glutathione S-transferase family protein [Stenomitos frigidus]PSB24938.1 glutathione S-transferase family protein [Stenomitos frigidus ULC18]
MAVSSLKLVSHTLCPYVQRAVITLHEKQIPYEREYVDLAQKPDWFLALSPLGKVPLLLVGDAVLFESAVICEYLDEVTPGSLHPVDPLLKARHRAWIEFGSSILNAIAGFYSAQDEPTFVAKGQELIQKWQTLEDQLQEGPFFSGDRFSLVDAVYGPIFRYFVVFEQYQDFGFFAETPKVMGWRDALLSRPSVMEAVLPTYAQLLHEFLLKRHSHLTQIIQATL